MPAQGSCSHSITRIPHSCFLLRSNGSVLVIDSTCHESTALHCSRPISFHCIFTSVHHHYTYSVVVYTHNFVSPSEFITEYDPGSSCRLH